jgi:hypothetical protein
MDAQWSDDSKVNAHGDGDGEISAVVERFVTRVRVRVADSARGYHKPERFGHQKM